jgi:hypothetical protein
MSSCQSSLDIAAHPRLKGSRHGFQALSPKQCAKPLVSKQIFHRLDDEQQTRLRKIGFLDEQPLLFCLALVDIDQVGRG